MPKNCGHHEDLICGCGVMNLVAYNGLCTCRGWWEPHPFHLPLPAAGHTWTSTKVEFLTKYVGKHRMPAAEIVARGMAALTKE